MCLRRLTRQSGQALPHGNFNFDSNGTPKIPLGKPTGSSEKYVAVGTNQESGPLMIMPSISPRRTGGREGWIGFLEIAKQIFETYGDIPLGQKLFVIDGQEIPILELGIVEFKNVLGEGRAAS